jgi:release factor glutamine methyltransferase
MVDPSTTFEKRYTDLGIVFSKLAAMTIDAAQRHGEALLRQANIESSHLDTTLLLEKVTGKPRSWLLAHGDEGLSESQTQELMHLIDRRAQHTPLVHLTNAREFYGLDFYIDDRVLTPRVETETMVEYAIKYAPKDSRLIDIGTGSGVLAVAIKKHRPDLEVWATDVSEEALAVAHQNAERHRIAIQLVASDLFGSVRGHFATIVTNLPYLRNDAELMPEVTKEPAVALFGGQDGLELYRRFLEQLPAHLQPGGYLFTECDPWQHEKLIELVNPAGLKLIESNNYFILGFQRA